MATRTASIRGTLSANAQRVIWTGLTFTSTDDGSAVELHRYADRSVQVTGTFGTGGSVSLEGSNDDGTTWKVLTDPQGNPVTFTSAGIEQITEITQKVRPRVTAGDGTTNLAVYLFAVGANVH
jgi:hypothetical protein